MWLCYFFFTKFRAGTVGHKWERSCYCQSFGRNLNNNPRGPGSSPPTWLDPRKRRRWHKNKKLTKTMINKLNKTREKTFHIHHHNNKNTKKKMDWEGKEKLEAETKRFAPPLWKVVAKRSASIDSFGEKGLLELERKSFIFQFLTTGKIIRKSTLPTPVQTFPSPPLRRLVCLAIPTQAPDTSAGCWMSKKSLDTQLGLLTLCEMISGG